jgi:hypothetical protein
MSNWNTTKKKLKKRFTFLTEEDLLLQAGKQDEMLARLEVKLGKNKQQLLRYITSL